MPHPLRIAPLGEHGPKYETTISVKESRVELSTEGNAELIETLQVASPVVKVWPLRSRIAYYLVWPYMRLRYRYPLRP